MRKTHQPFILSPSSLVCPDLFNNSITQTSKNQKCLEKSQQSNSRMSAPGLMSYLLCMSYVGRH